MTKLKLSFQWTSLLFAGLFIIEGTAHAKEYKRRDNKQVEKIAAPRTFKATLLKFADGDTATVRDKKNKNHKIRFLGMDTPELHFENKMQSPWAQDALDRLHEMVNANPAKVDRSGMITGEVEDRDSGEPIEVEVEVSGVDHYGRELGYIFYDGKNLNLELTKEGWATPYLYCAFDKRSGRACSKNWMKAALVQDFVEACDDAVKAKIGLFDKKNPVKESASEFRQRVSGRAPYQYIGDYKTKKLYAPKDGHKVDWCNQIRFDRAEDAQDHGFDY